MDSDITGVILEDSIMQKGRPAAAGSKMLEIFISPLDATVVTRLESAGKNILRAAEMPELGIPDWGADMLGVSGAVNAVADGVAAAALCNDCSGAARRQAARRGLRYIHPTYGTVSRYGLIPVASSMDQIGVVCGDVEEGFRVLSKIAGYDPKDGAMFPDTEYSYGPDRKNLKIGVPSNIFDKPPEFTGNFETVSFELKYFDVYSQVMQILCCAEIMGNINRYDGVKFGYRSDAYGDLGELYAKSRAEAFGSSVKLAAIMGAFVLSQENYTQYYDKAMRIRRLIKESLDFNKYDAIIMPVFDGDPHRQFTLGTLPQLAGLPSVTAPANGGISLIADVKCENILFSALEVAGI